MIAAAAHGSVNRLAKVAREVADLEEVPEKLCSQLHCLFEPILQAGGTNWEEGKIEGTTSDDEPGGAGFGEHHLFNVSPNVLALFHAKEFLPGRHLVSIYVNQRPLAQD